MNDLFSRNWLFVPEKVQQQLGEIRFLTAGSGLGSFIAIALARLGVQKFIIADGDAVELSNLNRQHFLDQHLGQNKARGVAAQILAVNPRAEVEIVEEFLTKETLPTYIAKADLVLNTIDFDSEAFVVCSNLCRELGKIELFCFNLGFGCGVTVLDSATPSLAKFFGTTNYLTLKKRLLDYFILENTQASLWLKDRYLAYLSNPGRVEPQIIAGSLLNSAVISKIVFDLVSGNKVRRFPEYYFQEV